MPPDRRLLTLACGHLFCGPCIEDWFGRESTCPTCRRPFPSLRRCTATTVAAWAAEQEQQGQDDKEPEHDAELQQPQEEEEQDQQQQRQTEEPQAETYEVRIAATLVMEPPAAARPGGIRQAEVSQRADS
eukprot:COSAG04_NODE_4650_length_1970_cov_2.408872_3_plen_130_part_00